MEETQAPQSHKVILVLTKGDVCVIVKDFIYPFAPQTYYQRVGVLGIETYELDYVKGNKAFYKYVEPK